MSPRVRESPRSGCAAASRRPPRLARLCVLSDSVGGLAFVSFVFFVYFVFFVVSF
jgi:hypothetical protein